MNIFKFFKTNFMLAIVFITLSFSSVTLGQERERLFVASIFSGNTKLDPSSVKTAGQFITLNQLTRPLTQLNKEGQIEGQLVNKWRIRNNFKDYIFTISDDAKWSDGTTILSKDVKDALDRQIDLNSSNHFDFGTIKEVQIIDIKTFTIRLKEKNINFIRQVSYPEFGVVAINKKNGALDFKKTTGAYSLDRTGTDHFILKKNIFFPFHTKSSPNNVRIEWGNSNDKYSKALSYNLDFFIPFSDMGKNRLNEILSKKYTKTHPHIGYSFWVTINPKSKKLEDKSVRRMIQFALKSMILPLDNYSPFWVSAEQLYLPDGQGRPSASEISKIWNEIKKEGQKKPLKDLGPLKLLIDDDFPFKNEVINTLKGLGLTLEVDEWASGSNFYDKIKNKQYDLMQVRNDFSSIDLHENLQTTLNPLHPLIITSEKDNQFQDELKKALNTEDNNKRQEIYKHIARKVLTESYIAPIAYHKVLFVHKNNVDISGWSTLFPDILLWKVKIHDENEVLNIDSSQRKSE